MAKERLSMRKVREILRLKYDSGLTDRQIAKSCSVARSTVASYLRQEKGTFYISSVKRNQTNFNIIKKTSSYVTIGGAYHAP